MSRNYLLREIRMDEGRVAIPDDGVVLYPGNDIGDPCDVAVIDNSGQRVNTRRYFITRVISTSSYSTVMSALDLLNGTGVAIKISHKDLESVDAMVREINTIEAVWKDEKKTPFIVNYRGTIYHDGIPGYVMDECDTSLSKAIDEHRPIVLFRALSQAAYGLAYLHSLGIIHGDIKSDNILLSFANTGGEVSSVMARLSDFGLSSQFGDTVRSFYGTMTHAAPESLIVKNMTPEMEIWAFGCILYEALVCAYSDDELYGKDGIKEGLHTDMRHFIDEEVTTKTELVRSLLMEFGEFPEYYYQRIGEMQLSGETLEEEDDEDDEYEEDETGDYMALILSKSPTSSKLMKLRRAIELDTDSVSLQIIYDLMLGSLSLDPKKRISIQEICYQLALLTQG